MKSDKTKEEILNQSYLSAKDLKILIPTLGKQKCINIIKETIEELRAKGEYVIETKPLIVPKEFLLKKLNIKR